MGKNDRTQNYRNDYNWDDELDDDSPLDDDDLGGHYTGNRNYGSGRSGGGNTNTLLVIICVLLAMVWSWSKNFHTSCMAEPMMNWIPRKMTV